MCAALLPKLILGRPAVSKDYLLVGTDDPNGESHFMIALSIKALEEGRRDPIMGFSSTTEVSQTLLKRVLCCCFMLTSLLCAVNHLLSKSVMCAG